MRFVSGATNGGSWSWWLYDGSSQTAAWAGEEFVSASNAKRAAVAFKSGAARARFEVYLDAAGKWRWRAWRSSDKVAASGRSFPTQAEAAGAAEAVQLDAGTASGP